MNTIKFFHPEETFTYHIEKCFCKVVYSGQRHLLIIEIQSTEDLDHVEGDALQNNFPQVMLTVEDFPVKIQNRESLAGNEVLIPQCYVETEDEEGEIIENFYANAIFSDGEFEADNNQLIFSKSDSGNLRLKWKGEVQDFTEESDSYIPFEAECEFFKFLAED